MVGCPLMWAFVQEGHEFTSIILKLINEAEYLTKNYGDRGGCITLSVIRDLHNSSYDTKAEFNNCFIIHLK